MKEIDEEFFKCPSCDSDLGVVTEWSSWHSKECLLHCFECDKIFLICYKFDKAYELKREEIKKSLKGDDDAKKL